MTVHFKLLLNPHTRTHSNVILPGEDIGVMCVPTSLTTNSRFIAQVLENLEKAVIIQIYLLFHPQ